MDLLKRENWWVWLILTIFTANVSILLQAALLKCFKKDAWYANWKNWVLGFALFIIPGIVMVYIFMIQMACEVANKLEIPGSELYLSPYVWILCIIIPVIGWIIISVMMVYITVFDNVMLYKGHGEKYIR
jgi:uncharacterized membrane protein YhaH (DUF805 family)